MSHLSSLFRFPGPALIVIAGASAVLAQPEGVTGGLAMAASGGVGQIGASVMQLGSGLMQGFTTGDFTNSFYATASLATGWAIERAIVGPAISGYRTVSQRAADRFAHGSAIVIGGVDNRFIAYVDAAAPRQVNCR